MGEEVFAHDIAIRVPMPTGRKDHTRLAGHVHVDWHQFTVWPFQGVEALPDGGSGHILYLGLQ